MQEKFIYYRKPLEHTYRKLMVDKKLNVVYFGGSITHGYGSSEIEEKSWRALSVKWLKKHFPKAQINDIRAAIGESGTFLGVYRLERDVLSQKPDLLFIEFAVNDLSHETSEEMAAMQYETIVREVKSKYPQCDIVTLLTESWGTAKRKDLFPAARGHEKISELYQIPTLWLGKSLIHQLKEITEKEWAKYFIDTVHPNDQGYWKYYQCVEAFLENSLLKTPFEINETEETQELPPIYSKSLLDGKRTFLQCSQKMLGESQNFSYAEEIFVNLPKTPYVGYLYTSEKDAVFTYRFYGTEVGIYSNFYDKEQIEYSIDEKPWERMFCSIHNPTVIAQHLTAKEHILKVRPLFTEKEKMQWKIGAVFSRDESEETKMQEENMFSSIEERWFGKKNVGNDYFVCFEGDLHRICEGVSFWASSTSFADGEINTTVREIRENYHCVEKTNVGTGVCVEAFYETFGDVIRRTNRVTNLKEDEKNLIHISSAAIHIPADGLLAWNDPKRFSIYLCTMGWSTENQWKKCTLAELGILPIRKNPDGSAYRHTIRSEGSWSTGRYYPLVIVEDHETGNSYFMEHEGAVSWEINIGMGFFTTPETLSIECGSADIHHDGFVKKLKQGESYETTPAICGMVSGGFEEAVAALQDYKRKTSLRTWEKGYPPVCYNVFMGAVFSKINEKNLFSLIDAAAEVGCEVFCIDAGWFFREGKGNLGDYIPDDRKFGTYSLQDILDRIKEKEMVPGLWFELEASAQGTDCIKISEQSVLKRYGTVISKERGFYDLSIPEVRKHILTAIDRAYAMGVRYIKNDYNQSTGIGFGDGPADFNHKNRNACEAFYEMIDEIYRRYPDMVIENCGSGAMREDHGTLSHFHLQSTSDQELFYHYPAIAAGAASLMPLEKAGNWAYPYALGEDEYERFDREEETEFLIERNKNGENTIFSMINGMLGVLYMSGRIDYLDEWNKALVKEAVNVYKKMRMWIPKMYPIYPTGFGTIGKREFVTLGIKAPEQKRIYLALWKINAPEDTVTIDLSSYVGKNAKVKRIYPEKDERGKFTYAEYTRKLTVQLCGSPYMARLFEIEDI